MKMKGQFREYREVKKFLDSKGFFDSPRHGLDVFARDGKMRSVDLTADLGWLDAWDISAYQIDQYVSHCKKTRRVQTDSIKCLGRYASHGGKFWDLIIIDNPIKCFGDGYCEHFDVFENAVKCLGGVYKDKAIVFNVAAGPCEGEKKKYHIARRKAFYGFKGNDTYLSLERIKSFYDEYFRCLFNAEVESIRVDNWNYCVVAYYIKDKV